MYFEEEKRRRGKARGGREKRKGVRERGKEATLQDLRWSMQEVRRGGRDGGNGNEKEGGRKGG